MRYFLYIIAALLCFSNSAMASEQLNIAGITIDMSPDQAQTALEKTGYTPYIKKEKYSVKRAVIHGPNFSETIALRKGTLKRNEAKGAIKQYYYVKGTESLTVEFLPWTDGEKVSRVIYRNKDEAATFEHLLSALKQKYGAPDGHEYKRGTKWSSAAPDNRGFYADGTIRLNLSQPSLSKPMITLSKYNVSKRWNSEVQKALAPPANSF